MTMLVGEVMEAVSCEWASTDWIVNTHPHDKASRGLWSTSLGDSKSEVSHAQSHNLFLDGGKARRHESLHGKRRACSQLHVPLSLFLFLSKSWQRQTVRSHIPRRQYHQLGCLSAENTAIHLPQRRPPTSLTLLFAHSLIPPHHSPRRCRTLPFNRLPVRSGPYLNLDGNDFGPVRKPFVHTVSTESSMLATVSWAPVKGCVPGVMEKAQTSLAMLIICERSSQGMEEIAGLRRFDANLQPAWQWDGTRHIPVSSPPGAAQDRRGDLRRSPSFCGHFRPFDRLGSCFLGGLEGESRSARGGTRRGIRRLQCRGLLPCGWRGSGLVSLLVLGWLAGRIGWLNERIG